MSFLNLLNGRACEHDAVPTDLRNAGPVARGPLGRV
jgi:hypothetical protein